MSGLVGGCGGGGAAAEEEEEEEASDAGGRPEDEAPGGGLGEVVLLGGWVLWFWLLLREYVWTGFILSGASSGRGSREVEEGGGGAEGG